MNGSFSTRQRVADYLKTWGARGYDGEIPDEVPDSLTRRGLAPSYKAICSALLSNDLQLLSLGYAPKRSKWYDAIKAVEFSDREES